MVECNFIAVFLGIETPDESSLNLTKKFQNTRDSLSDSVEKIIRAGLRVMAGFIIGFDGEKTGAGDRVARFVQQTTIPIAMFSMLQALPDTALWHRLNKEGRLLNQQGSGNQTTLMNFVPTRPIEEIAREYIEAFWQIYDPMEFLDRTYRHFLILGAPRNRGKRRKLISLMTIRALAILFWRQGVVRETRGKFWIYLYNIFKHNPRVWDHYLTICAQFEHFYEYREIVRSQIESQLAEFLASSAASDKAAVEEEIDSAVA